MLSDRDCKLGRIVFTDEGGRQDSIRWACLGARFLAPSRPLQCSSIDLFCCFVLSLVERLGLKHRQIFGIYVVGLWLG
jgi:hypothetical protein